MSIKPKICFYNAGQINNHVKQCFDFGELPTPFRYGLYIIKQKTINPYYRVGAGGVNGGKKGVEDRLKKLIKPHKDETVISQFYPIWAVEFSGDNDESLCMITRICEHIVFGEFGTFAKAVKREKGQKWRDSLFETPTINDDEIIRQMNGLEDVFAKVVSVQS